MKRECKSWQESIGKKYGRLTVIEHAGQGKNWATLLRCLCDCGKEIVAKMGHIRSGNTSSCGCHKIEVLINRSTIHGAARGRMSRTYKIWVGMRQRCNNPKQKRYLDYGGRGILVCEEWNKSFEAFLRDMGDAPEGFSIERKDNNLGYSKENCRWATKMEQARNTSRNKMLTYNGKTQPMSAWAEEIGIGYGCLQSRIDDSHWPIEKALSTKCGERRKI